MPVWRGLETRLARDLSDAALRFDPARRRHAPKKLFKNRSLTKYPDKTLEILALSMHVIKKAYFDLIFIIMSLQTVATVAMGLYIGYGLITSKFERTWVAALFRSRRDLFLANFRGMADGERRGLDRIGGRYRKGPG